MLLSLVLENIIFHDCVIVHYLGILYLLSKVYFKKLTFQMMLQITDEHCYLPTLDNYDFPHAHPKMVF